MKKLVYVTLFTPFSQQTGKGTIWMGYTPSQHCSAPCLRKQSYVQQNLHASKSANTQLVETKPASPEDRLLPSPLLCIGRSDVSCTVISGVTAGWAEPRCWPWLREGSWRRSKEQGWWSFGVMEKASAFSASAAGPQQLFWLQHLKSFSLTLNYRQSSDELLWLLGAAWRGIHAKHKNPTVSVLALQACI